MNPLLGYLTGYGLLQMVYVTEAVVEVSDENGWPLASGVTNA